MAAPKGLSLTPLTLEEDNPSSASCPHPGLLPTTSGSPGNYGIQAPSWVQLEVLPRKLGSRNPPAS
jgi:hypothetical protein